MSDYTYRTATDLCALLRSGELGSRELLELQLDRVAKYDPRINAVVTLDAARARSSSARPTRPT